MAIGKIPASIKVFSTSPQSKDHPAAAYARQVADVAKWSEEAGCTGILVYTDNSIADPWLVAQVVLEHTRTLSPLVAVQPIYMHPYTAAKMVSTLGFLYGRRVYLNMVAGGFKNDLTALHDQTPHDRRYDRLVEFTTVIRTLLQTENAVSFDGEFYTIDKLKMTPPLPAELFPGIFISGSSEAGYAAAKKVEATVIRYPKPPGDYRSEPLDMSLENGLRIGIIARKSEEEAWSIARERFPEDRKGQLTHQLRMKLSDSVWHQQLSDAASKARETPGPYWLVPFESYKTNCPYLVGSYGTVRTEIANYIAVGYTTFILDIPPSREDLEHIGKVFRLAVEQGAA
jgi:alkanesulfonate monooxygenase